MTDIETTDQDPAPKSDKDMSQTELSEKRTGLSEHRTALSEHRTDLSGHRTDLSEKRTSLSNLRSHLSNERTHMSYLRTGISLISLGVTMNRFSLFLIQNKEMTRYGGRSLLHDTKNVGIGMVILGCALTIWSIFHFIKTADAINKASFKPAKWSIIIFTMIVIAAGTFAVAWLIAGD